MKRYETTVIMAALAVLCFFDPALESGGSAVEAPIEGVDAAQETATEAVESTEEVSEASDGDENASEGSDGPRLADVADLFDDPAATSGEHGHSEDEG